MQNITLCMLHGVKSEILLDTGFKFLEQEWNRSLKTTSGAGA